MADVEVKSRVWTLGELRDAHRGDIVVAETGGVPIRTHQPIIQTSGPLEIEFGTTQPKKIDEFREPLLAQTKDIRLASAVGSLGWWLCDPEESGTFAGNAAGKTLRLIDRIYNHHSNGYDRYVREQKRQGRNVNNIMYAVNDMHLSMIQTFRTIQFEGAADVPCARGMTTAPPPCNYNPLVYIQGQRSNPLKATGKHVHKLL